MALAQEFQFTKSEEEFLPHFGIGGSISNLPFLAAGLFDNEVNPLDLSKVWHYYAAYYVAVLTGKKNYFTAFN